jgi:2-C-methyl-D-erythritol 4-phosphate cytidylyltransferase
VRFGGDTPKQLVPLGDRRVLDWSLETASSVADGVVAVVPAGVESTLEGAPVAAVVAGGITRADSVRCGLAAVPRDAEIVVVHDAARPLAPAELFRSVIDAVRSGADAAVPAMPVIDTVKRVDGDVVVETLDRDELVAVQTPQAFRGGVLRRAHRDEPDATDDAALVERLGGRVVVVAGDALAAKLTDAADLDALGQMLP